MAKSQFNFRLPADLMDRVERARGDVSRTEFVVRALEERLVKLERLDAAREIVAERVEPAGMRPSWRRS